MEEQRPQRVLVVDDNSDTREFVGAVLETTGCDVRFALDGEEAMAEARRFHPDIVYLDVEMPKQDGWLVCAKLWLIEPSPRVILMTGCSRSDLFEFAEFVKADKVLRKPFSAGDVFRSLPHTAA